MIKQKQEQKFKTFNCFWTRYRPSGTSHGKKTIKALNKLDARIIFQSKHNNLLLDYIEEA